MKTNHLKSQTAKSIAKYYFKVYGETDIFDNAGKVEAAIDLAIKDGAFGREITQYVINYLKEN